MVLGCLDTKIIPALQAELTPEQASGFISKMHRRSIKNFLFNAENIIEGTAGKIADAVQKYRRRKQFL